MMKNILSILLCSIILSTCISCSEDGIDDTGVGRLKGTVVSFGDNLPLKNVKITTNPSSTTVFTDAEGKFDIEKITAREYSVQAELDGYKTKFDAANVLNGETSVVVFELKLSNFDNKPPTAPTLISPANDSIVEGREVNFIWTASDPDEDSLTYSLELRNDFDSVVERFESLIDTTYTYSTLKLGVKYFWQVSADDGIHDPVMSGVKSFSVTSPSQGNRFLFVRNINGNNVIFSADEAGNEFQLTSNTTNSYRPRRNVAADRIAYLQTTGAQVDVYTMKRDGSDKVKVTSNVRPNGFNLNEINISWPQTSDRIYFPSFDKLYSIRSSGQGLQEVYRTPDGSLISEVAINENGNMIVLKTNDINGYNVSIYAVKFDGTLMFTVLSGAQGASSGLDLSITNQQILYSYDIEEFQHPDYLRRNSRIFLYDLITNVATDISGEKVEGTNDLEPVFSPNEASVIFTNTSRDGISQKNVFSILINEVTSRQLLFSNAFMPDWE